MKNQSVDENIKRDVEIKESYERLRFQLIRMANFSPDSHEPLHYFTSYIDHRYLGHLAADAMLLIDRMRELSLPTWREDTLRAAKLATRRYNLIADIGALVDRELSHD